MRNIRKPDKVSLFLENAEKAASGTHLLREKEKLAGRIMELVKKDEQVYCPRATKLEKSAVAGLTALADDCSLATVTIEEVSAAIAETGSIIIMCDDGGAKTAQASLLPLRHVAIVPREKIFASLEDFFAKVSAPPPASITFITGPSRTTDIELELAIGVHGPGRVDIIVV
ncbi:MAG TPA: LUD domain-containing protein [Dissulfurispiraceae bacterium]|nr:LUD domain-containing protein [Dissulfurispiraceae bacterium]